MSGPQRFTGDTVGALVGDRLDGNPLVLLLDVDGTLAPIAPAPEKAEVPETTRAVLRRLVGLPGVSVALVSGRSARDAARLAGVGGVWVIGNHGFEQGEPDGDVMPVESVIAFEQPIALAAKDLALLEREISGVVVENKRWTLSVHYRQVDPSLAPGVIERTRAVAEQRTLRVGEGKMVVELRPPVDINKGTASVALAERLGAFHAHGSVAYFGDDRTDEDAFDALRRRSPGAVTVRVLPFGGEVEWTTAAEFAVESTEELRRVLEWIGARRSGD